jgi:hypothetical protein
MTYILSYGKFIFVNICDPIKIVMHSIEYYNFQEASMKHVITVLIAGALVMLFTALPSSAQETNDPADLVVQFLPEDATLLTVSKAELVGAVEKAITANPTRISEIIGAIAIVRPDAVEDIATAAVKIAPDELMAICYAAQDAAPERALDIPACQDIYGISVRLESLPVTKPAREEPSPVRPRL